MAELLEKLASGDKVYQPDAKTMSAATVKDYESVYAESVKNTEKFWSDRANELHWFKPWDKVLEWDYPWAKWFVGGKFNICYNALDRHVKNGLGDKAAFYWVGEQGDKKRITYSELLAEVKKFSNVLKSLGVKKGDKVTVYMPRIFQQVITLLACARIGAVHSVVYSGFSSGALKERVVSAGSKVIVTADGGFYKGKVVELKRIADEIKGECPTVEHVIVVRHANSPVEFTKGDLDWDELMRDASDKCECEVMDSEDPLFILYTSGTTGKPKGVLHVQGGYAVGVYTTVKWVFDMKPEDVYWCTADAGWITGHSYIVYGPLLNGATGVIYEGAPTTPDPGRLWSIIEDLKVTIFYTAPTAVRLLMKSGDKWPGKYDLSSLRLLGTVGEPINPEAWLWYRKITGNKLPIMDTWWQTETGMIMITPLPCAPLKPGSAAKPFPGVIADIVDEKGDAVPTGKGGYLVIRNPWPSMMRTVHNDPARYEKYWNTIPNVYMAGDVAHRDKDGYYWIMGRSDDVIKVSGYRLGSAEIESALVSHPSVAEAAVIGKPDEIRGEAIKVFVILREGSAPSDSLKEALKKHVRTEIGPIAIPSEIEFVTWLPKTRSGKIMRRVLKAKELGLPVGDTSTLED
ncbi:MAG: acetate--CoA ligase [Candidatus Aenigmarchaeota archaeon]|nr:acetate--CoA ligase [Candidatus Aenigmarchaeota archaeon]